MLRNANRPKNTAIEHGSTMMTSTTHPSGRPGSSTCYQRMSALAPALDGVTAGATTTLLSPEER